MLFHLFNNYRFLCELEQLVNLYIYLFMYLFIIVLFLYELEQLVNEIFI